MNRSTKLVITGVVTLLLSACSSGPGPTKSVKPEVLKEATKMSAPAESEAADKAAAGAEGGHVYNDNASANQIALDDVQPTDVPADVPAPDDALSTGVADGNEAAPADMPNS